MKEEILSVCISQLKAKVDSIMLDINGTLSNDSYEEGVADKLSGLIVQLSLADNSLRQATSLMAQAMAQRLAVVESNIKKKSYPEKQDEEE